MHGAEGGISEAAAQSLCCVASLVVMLLVEEVVERSMEGLDLRFTRSAKEAMALGEVDGVMQHMQLGKCGL